MTDFTFQYSCSDLQAMEIGSQITISINRVDEVFDISDIQMIDDNKWLILRQEGVYAGMILVN